MKTAAFTSILALALLATACSGDGGGYLPTAPTPPPPPPQAPSTGWSGMGLLDGVSGAESCLANDAQTRIGESFGPVGWAITQDGGSILLIEGTHNYPFDHSEWRGSVNGRNFTATLQNYLADGITGELSGTYSADGLRIEAASVVRYASEWACEYRFRWTLTKV